MATRQQSTARTRRVAPKASVVLGPGLHGATVELLSDRSARVRTISGERIEALLGDQVEPGLVEECLRDGRLVVLADSANGPTIVGALQTARAVAHRPDGTLEVRGKEVHLSADRRLVLTVGGTALRLEHDGVARIEGDRLMIDVGSLVRFLSCRVELP